MSSPPSRPSQKGWIGRQAVSFGEVAPEPRKEPPRPPRSTLVAAPRDHLARQRTKSFRGQMGMGGGRGGPTSAFAPATLEERIELAGEIHDEVAGVVEPFESRFDPGDMRQLALVAHNHMKPAMKEFINTYAEVLKKFRITGTQTTMRLCKTMWGEDDQKIEYGLTCTSGPLGGDAQIAALMCMDDLGALIFFCDPLSAHPHQADIDSLVRLSNCSNIIMCLNPTSAMSMMHVLKAALEKGSRGMIPSFFETLESPAVSEYKRQQQLALLAAINGDNIAASVSAANKGRDTIVGKSLAERTLSFDFDKDDDDDNSNDDDDEDEDHDDDFISDAILEALEAKFEDPMPNSISSRARRGTILAGVSIPNPKPQQRWTNAMKQLRREKRRTLSLRSQLTCDSIQEES